MTTATALTFTEDQKRIRAAYDKLQNIHVVTTHLGVKIVTPDGVSLEQAYADADLALLRIMAAHDIAQGYTVVLVKDGRAVDVPVNPENVAAYAAQREAFTAQRAADELVREVAR